MNSFSYFFHFGFVLFQGLKSLKKLLYMQAKEMFPNVSNHCHKVYYIYKNPNNNNNAYHFLHVLSVLAVSETSPKHGGLKQEPLFFLTRIIASIGSAEKSH